MSPKAFGYLLHALIIGHFALASLWEPTEFLLPGRLVLVFFGIFALIQTRRFTLLNPSPFKIQGLLTAIGCLLFFILPLGISFFTNWASYTYGNNGLSTEFRSGLPLQAAIFFATTLLGTEVIFRGLWFDRLEKALPSVSFSCGLSSLVYLIWVAAGLYPFLMEGESLGPLSFMLVQFCCAFIAALIYVKFQQLWWSALWSFLTGFLEFFLLSDFDTGLNPAFYFTTSSVLFYMVRIGIYLALIAGLIYSLRTESKTNE